MPELLVPLAITIVFIGCVDLLLLTSGSLSPRLLNAGPTRRTVRRWRASVQRAAAAIAGWPHVLLHLVGADLSAPVAATPASAVAHWGPATLWRYRSAATDSSTHAGAAVLLVHALVTRPWVLDLTPGRSLVRHLLEAGHDVYLLDWGDPGPDAATMGLEEAVEILMAAETTVCRERRRPQLHLVAYCSGALVAFTRLAVEPHHDVASVTAIAASFGAAGGMWALSADPALRPAWLLDGDGLVPAEVIRESFHLLRPQALRTVLARWKTSDPDHAAMVDALTRWLWEQRALPGRMLFDLVELARTNGLATGRHRIFGRHVDPTTISVPTRLIVGARDHLVPPASSLALTRSVPADTVVVEAGHVGLLVGENGPRIVYPATDAWIQAHDHGTHGTARSTAEVGA